MTHPIVIAPDQASSPLAVVGEKLTVLLDGEQTGSYEMFRQYGPAGSGPPPHSHPWDEAFFVIEGHVAFGLGTEAEQVATEGTLVHIPGGTVHWFRFAEGGGVMLSITSRPGASRFFTEVDAKISPTEPDYTALVGIASAHGITVPASAS